MDEDEPIAGPSGSRHGFADSDRVSESEQGSSSGSDEGSGSNGSEDEREQVQLQPAENEIEGDFESVYSFRSSNRF
jgi:hypothetical protein